MLKQYLALIEVEDGTKHAMVDVLPITDNKLLAFTDENGNKKDFIVRYFSYESERQIHAREWISGTPQNISNLEEII